MKAEFAWTTSDSYLCALLRISTKQANNVKDEEDVLPQLNLYHLILKTADLLL